MGQVVSFVCGLVISFSVASDHGPLSNEEYNYICDLACGTFDTGVDKETLVCLPINKLISVALNLSSTGKFRIQDVGVKVPTSLTQKFLQNGSASSGWKAFLSDAHCAYPIKGFLESAGLKLQTYTLCDENQVERAVVDPFKQYMLLNGIRLLIGSMLLISVFFLPISPVDNETNSKLSCCSASQPSTGLYFVGEEARLEPCWLESGLGCSHPMEDILYIMC